MDDAPHYLDGVDAPVLVRVNRRARRVSVRIDPTHRLVIATAPSQRAVAGALAFAESKADWLNAQLASVAPPQAFVAGGVFPLRGAPCRIEAADHPRRRTSQPEANVVIVGGGPEHLNRRLVDWLKKEARRDLTARADAHCATLGVDRSGIQIKDTRSRWGSCSSDKVLSFSWRLILAPPDILDYVAAHECAHLIHMDHSAAFWGVVDRLGVDAAGARRWFKDNGQDLHRWGVPMRAAA